MWPTSKFSLTINTFLMALIKRIASTIKTICQNDHLRLLVLLALDHLNWSPLQHRETREPALYMLFKPLIQEAESDYSSLRSAPDLFISHTSGPPPDIYSLLASCDSYKFSFWPRKITDWNNLPALR